jgi:phosphopantetheine adenylyltransferase
MRVEKFLKKEIYDSAEDYETQIELWAYIIAKHYNISLSEVYSMPPQLFKQSLVWAMVSKEETQKANEINKQKMKSGDREVVGLDYSFLDWE